MDMIFIKPRMFENKTKDAMFPLIFPIIKNLTPKDVNIRFLDESIENLSDNIPEDIIALTVETFCAKRAYAIAKHFKKQNKRIIMGGFHPSMCPDEALNYADSIIIGEAEDVWDKLIEDLKNNELKRIYQSGNNCQIKNYPIDYKYFNLKKYNPIEFVQFSRGCKFACEFCSVNAFYKNIIRTKNIEDIIQDIKSRKSKFIFFTDDNIFSNEKKAEELFRRIKPLKKKWICQISMDIAKNTKLLKLMKESGCIMLIIGFESLNTDNLIQMNKVANIKNENYEQLIKNIHDAKLMIYGTFIIGYDNDTNQTAKQLMDFAIKNKFAIANFNPLMPMPGTKLYERLQRENRLIYEKWWIDDKFSYGDAMLIPANMTPEELMSSCKNARYEFNSVKNILQRMFCKSNFLSPFNLFIYLFANVISKISIRTKQGKKLG